MINRDKRRNGRVDIFYQNNTNKEKFWSKVKYLFSKDWKEKILMINRNKYKKFLRRW